MNKKLKKRVALTLSIAMLSTATPVLADQPTLLPVFPDEITQPTTETTTPPQIEVQEPKRVSQVTIDGKQYEVPENDTVSVDTKKDSTTIKFEDLASDLEVTPPKVTQELEYGNNEFTFEVKDLASESVVQTITVNINRGTNTSAGLKKIIVDGDKKNPILVSTSKGEIHTYKDSITLEVLADYEDNSIAFFDEPFGEHYGSAERTIELTEPVTQVPIRYATYDGQKEKTYTLTITKREGHSDTRINNIEIQVDGYESETGPIYLERSTSNNNIFKLNAPSSKLKLIVTPEEETTQAEYNGKLSNEIELDLAYKPSTTIKFNMVAEDGTKEVYRVQANTYDIEDEMGLKFLSINGETIVDNYLFIPKGTRGVKIDVPEHLKGLKEYSLEVQPINPDNEVSIAGKKGNSLHFTESEFLGNSYLRIRKAGVGEATYELNLNKIKEVRTNQLESVEFKDCTPRFKFESDRFGLNYAYVTPEEATEVLAVFNPKEKDAVITINGEPYTAGEEIALPASTEETLMYKVVCKEPSGSKSNTYMFSLRVPKVGGDLISVSVGDNYIESNDDSKPQIEWQEHEAKIKAQTVGKPTVWIAGEKVKDGYVNVDLDYGKNPIQVTADNALGERIAYFKFYINTPFPEDYITSVALADDVQETAHKTNKLQFTTDQENVTLDLALKGVPTIKHNGVPLDSDKFQTDLAVGENKFLFKVYNSLDKFVQSVNITITRTEPEKPQGSLVSVTVGDKKQPAENNSANISTTTKDKQTTIHFETLGEVIIEDSKGQVVKDNQAPVDLAAGENNFNFTIYDANKTPIGKVTVSITREVIGQFNAVSVNAQRHEVNKDKPSQVNGIVTEDESIRFSLHTTGDNVQVTVNDIPCEQQEFTMPLAVGQNTFTFKGTDTNFKQDIGEITFNITRNKKVHGVKAVSVNTQDFTVDESEETFKAQTTIKDKANITFTTVGEVTIKKDKQDSTIPTTHQEDLALGNNTFKYNVYNPEQELIQTITINIKREEDKLVWLTVNGEQVPIQDNIKTYDTYSVDNTSVVNLEVVGIPTVDIGEHKNIGNNIKLDLAEGTNTFPVKVTDREGTVINEFVINIDYKEPQYGIISVTTDKDKHVIPQEDLAFVVNTSTIKDTMDIEFETIGQTVIKQGFQVIPQRLTVDLADGLNTFKYDVTKRNGELIKTLTLNITKEQDAFKSVTVDGKRFEVKPNTFPVVITSKPQSTITVETTGKAIVEMNGKEISEPTFTVDLAVGPNDFTFEGFSRDKEHLSRLPITIEYNKERHEVVEVEIEDNNFDIQGETQATINITTKEETTTINFVTIGNAQITHNGKPVVDNKHQVDLADGENNFEYVVTNPDGEVVQNITITINKKPTIPQTPIQPGIPTKPQIPIQPGIPTKPQIPIEPGIPTKPQIPIQPGIPTKPWLPIQPGIPTKPWLPIEPGIPTKPQIPIQPGIPTVDWTPIEPGIPTKPWLPIEPGIPTVDWTPIEPGIPTTDMTPIQPGIPTVDWTPIQPGIPTVDWTPIQPGIPTVDWTPIEPGIPTTDMTPIKPGITKPNKPNKPNNSPSYEISRPSQSQIQKDQEALAAWINKIPYVIERGFFKDYLSTQTEVEVIHYQDLADNTVYKLTVKYGTAKDSFIVKLHDYNKAFNPAVQVKPWAQDAVNYVHSKTLIDKSAYIHQEPFVYDILKGIDLALVVSNEYFLDRGRNNFEDLEEILNQTKSFTYLPHIMNIRTMLDKYLNIEFKADREVYNRKMTRGELALLLSDILDDYGLATNDMSYTFKDIHNNEYSIANVFQNGVMVGKSSEKFAQDDIVTYSELCVILERLHKLDITKAH